MTPSSFVSVDTRRSPGLSIRLDLSSQIYLPGGPGGPGGPSNVPIGIGSPDIDVVKPLSPFSPLSP